MTNVMQIYIAESDNFIHVVFNKQYKEAFIVDPAWNSNYIKKILNQEGIFITGILITHSHPDHINALEYFNNSQMPLFVGEKELDLWKDCPENAILVNDNDLIPFADGNIRVISTPGHTVGSVCYYIDEHLFTGDTLFIYGCGRADLPTGNAQDLFNSLQKIKQLPENTKLWTGHNYANITSDILKNQMLQNPYLMIDNLEDFLFYRFGAGANRTVPYSAVSKKDLDYSINNSLT